MSSWNFPASRTRRSKANLKAGDVDVERVVTLVDAPAFCEQWMSYDVMEDRIKDDNEDPYHPTNEEGFGVEGGPRGRPVCGGPEGRGFIGGAGRMCRM